MFSEPDDSPVYYHPGSPHAIADRAGVLSLKDREAHDILLSSFMVVRKNCDDTCSQKILEGLSDEKQLEYRENSKIGQSTLKTIKDDLSTGLDSCIRRCFGIFCITQIKDLLSTMERTFSTMSIRQPTNTNKEISTTSTFILLIKRIMSGP